MNSIMEKLRNHSTLNSTGCLLWNGEKGSNGHGRVWYNHRRVLVHRLIMHLTKGFDLNSQEQVNHIRECPNPNCWNVEHLYIGSQQDNMDDRSENTKFCRHGHELTGHNLISYKLKRENKIRYKCRTCQNISRSK